MDLIVSARKRPEDLYRMCEVAQHDKKNRAKANYSTDWHGQQHTLLWKFYNGVFKPCLGDFLLSYDEHTNELKGGAGFYVYDSRYVIGMTRFYVMPGWENKWIGQYILKEQMERAHWMGPPKMLISFNGYNKKIYDIYVNHIDKLPPIWSVFKPIGELDINNTRQFCCEAELRPE